MNHHPSSSSSTCHCRMTLTRSTTRMSLLISFVIVLFSMEGRNHWVQGEKLKRLPRIKTGLHYKDHEDVLLTVTKVGYVVNYFIYFFGIKIYIC